MRGEYAFSERRACVLVLLAVSSYRYRTRRDDGPLRERLVELARAAASREYWKGLSPSADSPWRFAATTDRN